MSKLPRKTAINIERCLKIPEVLSHLTQDEMDYMQITADLLFEVHNRNFSPERPARATRPTGTPAALSC